MSEHSDAKPAALVPSLSVTIQDILAARSAASAPLDGDVGPDQPPFYSIGRCLWVEDDVGISEPDHETLEVAWRRLFGYELDLSAAILKTDYGDCDEYLLLVVRPNCEPQAVVVASSYPGNSEICCALAGDQRRQWACAAKFDFSVGKKLSEESAADAWFKRFRRDLCAEPPVLVDENGSLFEVPLGDGRVGVYETTGREFFWVAKNRVAPHGKKPTCDGLGYLSALLTLALTCERARRVSW